MAFCDFCPCKNCETGLGYVSDVMGNERISESYVLTHAKTTDGRWICDVCFTYDECVRKQREAGERKGPCDDETCSHRPRLVTGWSKLNGTVVT